jgi:hypothetical protein
LDFRGGLPLLPSSGWGGASGLPRMKFIGTIRLNSSQGQSKHSNTGLSQLWAIADLLARMIDFTWIWDAMNTDSLMLKRDFRVCARRWQFHKHINANVPDTNSFDPPSEISSHKGLGPSLLLWVSHPRLAS